VKRAITAALALLAAPGNATPACADTLIDNLDGITVDAHGGIEHFTGILIGPDGRIVQVLHQGDKRPGKVDFALDGKGAHALPGLIDAHAHVMETGFAALTLDLSGTKSLAEAQARIAAYAAAHPDRSWILGGGWNQEVWAQNDNTSSRFPTAADLDAVAPDRPVWLLRADGHAGWANGKALALAHVTAATADPAGGHVERLPAAAPGKAKAPAGVFVDNAKALIAAVVPQPRPQDRDLALRTAQDIFLSHGVTAAEDMGTSIEDWQSFRRAGDAGALQMRIMAYAAGTDAMVLIAGAGPTPWLYDDRLRCGGIKIWLDGALGSRGALLKADYADAPGQRGLALHSDTQLKNLMSRGATDDFQVAVHAIGDAANAELLDAIADLATSYTGDRRWRIEHAQIVDPADIPKFGHNGIIASMQPTHQTSDRLMAEKRLGAPGSPGGARLAGAYAWRSIAATGARLAFGSDTPVEAPDPFAGIAAASTRQDAAGQPFGGWQPQERVTREEALAAYTTGAAYAGFAEGRFGRIATGERADFILVDRDVLLVSASDLRATKVLQTWVGGHKVWQAKDTPAPTRGMSSEGR
jgi:predicted amidohydrolase YtcJ